MSECTKRVSCYCDSCRTLNRETSSVLCPYLNNTSVLCPRCPYSLRTLSVVSTRSPCCLRGWTSVLSNVIRTLSATSVLSPYCIRRYPLSAGNLGQFVNPLLHPYWLRTLSVLSPPISANLKNNSVLSPYSLREILSVLYPLPSAASVRRCEKGFRSAKFACIHKLRGGTCPSALVPHA